MISFILLLFYYKKFSSYSKGWARLLMNKSGLSAGIFNENHRFSIIIPCRNEANHLIKLFKSLEKLNYEKYHFEIIFIDDHSTDETLGLFNQFKINQPALDISIYELKNALDSDSINSYKKEALNYGIKKSKYEYIVTTDGDCVVPRNWLQSFNNGINNGFDVIPKFLSAPVKYEKTSGFFNSWLCLEYGILNSIGGADIAKGTPSMANGANLCFNKEAFFEVGGYQDIEECASGDDQLLLYKFSVKYPNQIGFLATEQAMVTTAAPKSLKEFIQQRLRWTSKANYYQDKRVNRTLVFAWVTFLIMFLESLLYLYFGIILRNIVVIISPLVIFYFKYICEKQLIDQSLKLYQLDTLRKKIGFLSSTIHVFYSLYIGLVSRFVRKYEWKDRKVS
jgi:cellulose synthase/poly-beta-1,6-N-acetylglucosamine synthase-like glycosyltransferase